MKHVVQRYWSTRIPDLMYSCPGFGDIVHSCLLTYHREEWAFPGAIMIDPNIDSATDAYNLPNQLVDYIFSSHCLEHLADWVGALDHWHTRLRPGGVMFLYLPHYAQTYWRPWNNRKHVSVMQAQHLQDYFQSRHYKKIMVTQGYDLNHSFYAIAEK